MTRQTEFSSASECSAVEAVQWRDSESRVQLWSVNQRATDAEDSLPRNV
jgi:hypothetical protein